MGGVSSGLEIKVIVDKRIMKCSLHLFKKKDRIVMLPN